MNANRKEVLVNEIKYFKMYLGEVWSMYYANEKICDWAEKTHRIKEYGCLGTISSALVKQQHILICNLFSFGKDDNSIKHFCNKVLSNKSSTQKEKKFVTEIRRINDSIENDISGLMEYRSKVYVHHDKKLFDEEWQQRFKQENTFDYQRILVAIKQIYTTLNEMLIESGESPDSIEFYENHDIIRLLQKL